MRDAVTQMGRAEAVAYGLFARCLKAEMGYFAGRPIAELRAHRERVRIVSPSLARVRRTAVTAGSVPATWFTPRFGDRRTARSPVVLYFHGGGYVFGSATTHADSIARLAHEACATVLAVDYRLAPEAPFPAAVDDAVAAYGFLLGRDVDPSRIVVAGDSAGGGLALALLLALRDRGAPSPARALLWSPWVALKSRPASFTLNAARDFLTPMHLDAWADAYLDGHDASAPLASPLFADLRSLPRLFVHIGDAEVLRDDAIALAGRARAAGVQVTLDVVPRAVHSFQMLAPLFPSCARAFSVGARFVGSATE